MTHRTPDGPEPRPDLSKPVWQPPGTGSGADGEADGIHQVVESPTEQIAEVLADPQATTVVDPTAIDPALADP